MVADSLQLQQNRSHDGRGGRDFDFRGPFDCLAERGPVRETGISDIASRKNPALRMGKFLKGFFRPLVVENHSGWKKRVGLAGKEKVKCPGSMIPAWTGPTGTCRTPSPSAG